MAAPDTVVDFAEELAAFDEHWSPKIVGQVNDLHVKRRRVDLSLALRLLDSDERHPSLRVHQLQGDLTGLWSASASDVLRLTFVRTAQGRKTMVSCSRHYDR